MWCIEYHVQKMEYKLVSDEGILTKNVCNSYTVFGAIEGHDVWMQTPSTWIKPMDHGSYYV